MKNVRIDRVFGDDVPPVRMLPEAVQQVVINLIINAVDAMEQAPEPRLGVRVSRSGGWCALEISDNGHGITEENRKRLFEPFFTTKPVGKGTGLGLSITYSLVQAHGGRLDVESTPGKGWLHGAPARDRSARGRTFREERRAVSSGRPGESPPSPAPIASQP